MPGLFGAGIGQRFGRGQDQGRSGGRPFVINGQKIWTSSAHYSDMMFLLCRTEPDKPKHQGLSYLLVPMNRAGIEVRPLVTMTGRATFNETFFTDVRVPPTRSSWGAATAGTSPTSRSSTSGCCSATPTGSPSRLARIRELMERTTLDGQRIMDIPEYRDRLLRLQGEVDGFEVSWAAAADRAGAGRGLRAQAADRQV